MKSFLIIGLGSFGHHLTRYLAQQKCELLIVDKNEEKMQDLLDCATSARIADCTNIEVLKTFDVESFDACFVCVDSDFQAALEITCLLSDLKAKKIFSNADHDIQARLLHRNGADQIIYPEKDVARRLAIRESSDSIFDCLELAENYYVFEISVMEEWIGKTLREINFRVKYGLTVLAEKANGIVRPINDPNFVFKKDMHLLVIGEEKDIHKVTAD